MVLTYLLLTQGAAELYKVTCSDVIPGEIKREGVNETRKKRWDNSAFVPPLF